MNTQITEDYCSFEIAKLLKEKGFNELTCGFYYDNYAEELIVSSPSNHNGSINAIAAPSQAQVMKWLREVHNIFIQVDYIWSPKELYTYTFDIRNMKNARSIFLTPYGESFNSHEESCEEAIKYCLTNLI